MSRAIYTIVLGLVGAAVVHLAVLLLVPIYSERDAWSRLGERAPLFTLSPITGPDSTLFSRAADPLLTAAACRFALGTGIARFAAVGDVPYWAVSVHDRFGQEIYSFNDRTATDRQLDVVIASPAQMVELRKELPEEYENSVFVETDQREGILVVRAFVPDQSWSGVVSKFIDSAVCRQE